MKKSKRFKNKKRKRQLGSTKNVSLPRAKTSVITNNGGLKEIRIKHREFVSDIITSNLNYDFKQRTVNPGMDESFPWLHKMAGAFESYVFNSLTINFVTSMGTDTNGAIAIIPDYDASDDNAEQSKSQLLAYQDSVRGPVWSNLKMQCTRKNLRKRTSLYIREKALSDNNDIKLYDALNYSVLVTGLPADQFIGELWMEYDITLMTPQLEPSIPESSSIKNNASIGTTPYNGATVVADEIGLKLITDTIAKITQNGDWLAQTFGYLSETVTPDLIKPIVVDLLNKGDVDIDTLYKVYSEATNSFSMADIVTTRNTTEAYPAVFKWEGVDFENPSGLITFLQQTFTPLTTAQVFMYKEMKELKAKEELKKKEKDLKTEEDIKIVELIKKYKTGDI